METSRFVFNKNLIFLSSKSNQWKLYILPILHANFTCQFHCFRSLELKISIIFRVIQLCVIIIPKPTFYNKNYFYKYILPRYFLIRYFFSFFFLVFSAYFHFFRMILKIGMIFHNSVTRQLEFLLHGRKEILLRLKRILDGESKLRIIDEFCN